MTREWLTDYQIEDHIRATRKFAYVLSDEERRADLRRQREEAIAENKRSVSHDDSEGVTHADG